MRHFSLPGEGHQHHGHRAWSTCSLKANGAGTKLTINGGDYSADNGGDGIQIDNGAVATVVGDKVMTAGYVTTGTGPFKKTQGGAGMEIFRGSAATVVGAKVTSTGPDGDALFVDFGSTLTIKGGDYSAEKGMELRVLGATATMCDGNIRGGYQNYYGAYIYEVGSYPTTFNMEGGTITGGIYSPDSTVTITGGTSIAGPEFPYSLSIGGTAHVWGAHSTATAIGS